MNKELLEVGIVDTSKLKSYKLIKRKVSIVHIVILSLFYIIGTRSCDSTVSDDDFVTRTVWIAAIGILILFGSVYAIVRIYARTPCKGKLLFFEKSIAFIIGKDKTEIELSKLDYIEFHFERNHERENQYKIGIPFKGEIRMLELDIAYQHEKAELQKIIGKWKVDGFDVKVIDGQTIRRHCTSCHTQSFSLEKIAKIDFRKHKIKMESMLFGGAIVKIPYKEQPKEALFMLGLECIEHLCWAIPVVGPSGYTVYTDPVFKSLGDEFKIIFGADSFVIKCRNYGSPLINLGSKSNIDKFLEAMTDTSGVVDFELLTQEYYKMMEQFNNYRKQA